MYIRICFPHVVVCSIYSCFGPPTFFYLLCFWGSGACTLSDIAMHKTMSLSIPVLFTLPDTLSVWFWSLWADVAPRWWLMSVLACFHALQYHFSCCSRPVSVVTVAPCSLVPTGLLCRFGVKWKTGRDIPWVGADLSVFSYWIKLNIGAFRDAQMDDSYI